MLQGLPEGIISVSYTHLDVYKRQPLLRASDLKEEFRLLADFGCAVLAGRECENDRGYQFVTWVWDFDRRGVSHGHYFEGNYHAAKEDFAVRSGLISRAQIFSADQLAELYRATDFFLEEGLSLIHIWHLSVNMRQSDRPQSAR